MRDQQSHHRDGQEVAEPVSSAEPGRSNLVAPDESVDPPLFANGARWEDNPPDSSHARGGGQEAPVEQQAAHDEANDHALEGHDNLDAALQPSGEGRPLEPTIRRELERSTGYRLNQVRVHVGGSQGALLEKHGKGAATKGRHIVFPSGGYSPNDAAGMAIIRHEVNHVIQQATGQVGSRLGNGQRAQLEADANAPQTAHHAGELRDLSAPETGPAQYWGLRRFLRRARRGLRRSAPRRAAPRRRVQPRPRRNIFRRTFPAFRAPRRRSVARPRRQRSAPPRRHDLRRRFQRAFPFLKPAPERVHRRPARRKIRRLSGKAWFKERQRFGNKEPNRRGLPFDPFARSDNGRGKRAKRRSGRGGNRRIRRLTGKQWLAHRKRFYRQKKVKRDGLHKLLGGAGYLPYVGTPADLLNAYIYHREGKFFRDKRLKRKAREVAGGSLGGLAVPGVGKVVGKRLAKRVIKQRKSQRRAPKAVRYVVDREAERQTGGRAGEYVGGHVGNEKQQKRKQKRKRKIPTLRSIQTLRAPTSAPAWIGTPSDGTCS